jgi:hypothetical protein
MQQRTMMMQPVPIPNSNSMQPVRCDAEEAAAADGGGQQMIGEEVARSEHSVDSTHQHGIPALPSISPAVRR